MKANATDGTKDTTEEIEVDISEEARQFMPTEVSRFEKQVEEREDEAEETENELQEDSDGSKPDEPKVSISDKSTDEVLNMIRYIPPEVLNDVNGDSAGNETGVTSNERKPRMLEGIDLDEFVSGVRQLAEKGNSKFGDIIYELEEAA